MYECCMAPKTSLGLKAMSPMGWFMSLPIGANRITLLTIYEYAHPLTAQILGTTQ